IYRSARKRWLGKPPVCGYIVEAQRLIVSISVVGNFYYRYLIDEILFRNGCVRIFSVGGEIMVGDIPRVTIGDDDVAVSIIVKVSERWRPAPVGFCHAR